MYTPQSFKEERLDVLQEFIRCNPFGLLVSNGENGPLASSIPFHLITDTKPGTLHAHLARANPHWQSIDGCAVLVVFEGKNAYISPNWYPSKDEDGKVVPTWNYVMVQARGVARVIDDAVWLKKQITVLTNQQEARYAEPWKVSDAPENYIDAQIKGIIGLEIKLSTLEGKWKVSQNRAVEDRKGVAANLSAQGDAAMASLVREYGFLNE